MNNKIVLVIVALLLVLGGVYYMMTRSTADVANDDMVGVQTNTIPVRDMANEIDEDITESTEADEDSDENDEESNVKTFEVTGGMFYFSPDEITVNRGDTVRIVFTNEEGMHDWVLDEFDAKTDVIEAGETAEVEFVADQAGTFEFYCSVGNHREQGMVGTLVVEE